MCKYVKCLKSFGYDRNPAWIICGRIYLVLHESETHYKIIAEFNREFYFCKERFVEV
jgi:hypothetical protein